MEEIAEVIDSNGDKALVRVKRQSACNKCEHNCMLAGDAVAVEVEEMEIEVNNPVGADKGSMVQLKMDEKPVVFASLLIYLLPLFFLIGGYYLGNWLYNTFVTGSSEVAGIIGSIMMLLISFIGIHFVDNRLLKSRQVFQPRITRILD